MSRITAVSLPLDVFLKYLTLFAFANRPGVCSDILRLVTLNLMMFLSTNNTSYFITMCVPTVDWSGSVHPLPSNRQRLKYDDCLQHKRERFQDYYYLKFVSLDSE